MAIVTLTSSNWEGLLRMRVGLARVAHAGNINLILILALLGVFLLLLTFK
jgi:hypothetical protein